MKNTASLLLLLCCVACAPRVFNDTSTLAILGSAPEPVAEAEPATIELPEKVRFAQSSDRILRYSYAMLDDVAETIKQAEGITKIRVEGHASSEGDDQLNLELSTRRAAAVREYLVARGVDPGVLESEGFGEAQPIASNRTEEGRAANRRVELRVIERTSDSSRAAAP